MSPCAQESDPSPSLSGEASGLREMTDLSCFAMAAAAHAHFFPRLRTLFSAHLNIFYLECAVTTHVAEEGMVEAAAPIDPYEGLPRHDRKK